MGTIAYLKTDYKPEEKKENILKFPLMNFFHTVFEIVKKRSDDIRRKKISYLYKQIYKFFLDEYLMRRTKNEIDFPDFMYETGKIICPKAQYKAEDIILQIIQKGQLDRLYTKCKKDN